MSYMQLSNKGKLTNKFCYFDLPEHLADSLFKQKGVKVKITDELGHTNIKYHAILCKVPKSQYQQFDDCMKQLAIKMLIFGNTDYEDFCMDMITNAGGKPNEEVN